MKINFHKCFQTTSIVCSFLGVLAMMAAKIAASQGGMFLSRTEIHWFNDSITVLLLSISISVLLIVEYLKN